MENFKLTKNMLKGGKILNKLLEMYNEDNSVENFYGVLKCLRDSNVIVPLTVSFSQEDNEKLNENNSKFMVEIKNNINTSTDLIESTNGKKYFPVFSEVQQISDKYKNTVANLVSVPFLTVLDMAATFDEAEGIAVDPFGNSFIVARNIYETVKNLPATAK